MGKEEQSKAEKLLERFNLPTGLMSIERKQCAEIVVDEVLTTLRNQAILSDEDLIYWTRVQRELNKIK